MTEREDAIAIANKFLDEPGADPDDDIRVISRQLIRATEVRGTKTGTAIRVVVDTTPGKLFTFEDRDLADCTEEQIATHFNDLAARGNFALLANWCLRLALYIKLNVKEPVADVKNEAPN